MEQEHLEHHSTTATIPDDELSPVQEHDQHAGDGQYWKIFVILIVLTAIEVLTYFVSDELGGALVPILITLMVVKLLLVAAYFMHLKYDAKLFGQVFWAGAILALAVYVVTLTTFHFWK
jgi:cytochrome c oxidase subunit 4